MITQCNYSVLMSVYKNEKADFLRSAINSIFEQTVLTNDFVIVCDGPLSEELDAVISEAQDAHKDVLHIIRLEKNMGLGRALNIGIKECKNELVARMDSDDISRPDRCEKQISVFNENAEISVCSGTVEEFAFFTDNIEAKRVLPENNGDIVEFSRKRNPFNHPCVMYKKSAVEAAGSYQDFYLLEDYYLWIRMLQKGYKGYNIQEPILWMRAGSDMYKRRSGLKYTKSQEALFRYMRKVGFISTSQYLKSVITRGVSSLIPNSIRKLAYKKVLRESRDNQ